MSKLKPLRSRLASLKRRRGNLRLFLALSGVGIVALIVLMSMFVADWSFEFPVWGRLLLIAGAGIALVTGFSKLAAPQFRVQETVEDMALLVERQQGIDSDLIAALQFEAVQASPDGSAALYGSKKLSGAVVEHVAEFSPGLNVFEGFSWSQVRNRSLWLGGLLVVIVALGLIFPGHARAFFARMGLAADHYPTSVEVNRIELSLKPSKHIEAIKRPPLVLAVEHGVPSHASGDREFPYGGAIDFRVTCTGEDLPPTGKVRIVTSETMQKNEFTLSRVGDSQSYSVSLPPLVESSRFQVFIDDAWTDPQPLVMIPLPVVEVDPLPSEPDYAKEKQKTPSDQQDRYVRVLEGSSVAFRVRCSNKKLKSAKLTLKVGAETHSFPLTSDGDDWKLAAEETVLERVKEQITYSVQVVDEHGLSLPIPRTGTIAVRPDRAPLAKVSVRDPKYVATGRPFVKCEASDDFGLKSVKLQVEVLRLSQKPKKPDAKPGETKGEIVETRVLKHANRAKRLSVREQLVLSTYKLNVGDTVRLRLLAEDERGNLLSQTTQSLVAEFPIADPKWLEDKNRNSFEAADKKLEEAIRQGTPSGGTP